MHKFYKYNKDFNVVPLFYRCLFWIAYAFPAGFICYYVPFYSYGLSVANIDGKTEDLWAPGLVSIVSNILVHHVQMMIAVRNWTWGLSIACFFSLLTVPVSFVLVEYFFGIHLWQRHFRDIYYEQFPIQLFTTLFTVSLICLPIYLWKAVKMMFLHHKYYPRQQQN